MATAGRETLRRTFDEAAERYDRARPGYPPALFDDLAALAIVSTYHVAGGDAAFFAQAQRSYELWDPATPPGVRLSEAADIPQDSAEVDCSGLFGQVCFRRYEWELVYATAAYLDVLATYSGHRALPPDARRGLFACIASLIDTCYGGRVAKRYLTELQVARRRAD